MQNHFRYCCNDCKKLIKESPIKLHSLTKPLDDDLMTCESCREGWIKKQVKVSQSAFVRTSLNEDHKKKYRSNDEF
jgi:hypothetical protein